MLYDFSMPFMNYWGNWGKPRISLKTSAFSVSKETLFYIVLKLKFEIIGVHFILEIKYWIELKKNDINKCLSWIYLVSRPSTSLDS